MHKKNRRCLFWPVGLLLGTFLAGCAATEPRQKQAGPETPKIRRIAVGFNPIGVALSLDQRFVYVACSTSNVLKKIEYGSWQTLSSIPLDGNPAWIAMVPQSEIVAVTSRSNTMLNLISVTGNYLLASIPCPQSPEKIVIDHTGQTAYIGSAKADFVTVIDLLKQKVIKKIFTNGPVFGLAISPESDFVIATTQADNFNIQVIDTRSLSVIKRASSGAQPKACIIDAQGQYAYIANYASEDVTFFYLPDQSPTLNLPVGKGPIDLALGPDGKRLYVSLQTEGAIAVVDLENQKVARKIPLGIAPWGIAVSRDGQTLLVANYDQLTYSDTGTARGSIDPALGTGAAERVDNNTLLVIPEGLGEPIP